MGDFRPGDRVMAHPATDAWMQGDRYGVVAKISPRATVLVRMDRSKRLRRFLPENLEVIRSVEAVA